jgi:hypothetical protein
MPPMPPMPPVAPQPMPPVAPQPVAPQMGQEAMATEAISTPIPNANNATPEEIMADPLTQELVQFLVGESEDVEILNTFIDKYGSEAYTMIKQAVMNQIAPGAQTEGMIEGAGTGLSDSIPGTIGAREKIAVSNQEYILPADVLYGLGDGDVEKGQAEADAMVDRVRMASKGTKAPPNEVNPRRVLPA